MINFDQDQVGPPDFRALFERAPNLYLVLDPTLRIVAASNAYCAATMTVRDEILGRGIFEVFPDNPDDTATTGVSNLRSSLQRVLGTGRPDAMPQQKYDIQRPGSEGGGFEERHWSPLNTPVLAPDGTVQWIIHRVEDVTEFVRMQAEGVLSQRTIVELQQANETLALRDEENALLQRDLVARTVELQNASSFLDLVVENIPAMVAVKDAKDLRFVLLNRAGEELTGIDRAESLGKNDYDFFPPQQAEFFVARDREVLASGELLVIPEEPIATRGKGDRVLRTLKMPVPDENGKPRYLLALSEDITERRQAETALRTSEAMFRSLLAASPDAVLVIDGEGRIVLASQRVQAMYGYSAEELVGMPIDLLTPERLRASYADRLRESMTAPDTARLNAAEDFYAIRRDGSEFPVEISISSHQSGTGAVIIVAVRDVTDRRAVETQLRQAQKMEAIGNLTGGLAHDFNNLLGVIIGNIDLLRERLSDDRDSDELAGEALSAALRGADLTQRLLAFARRQPLQPRRIDVNELVMSASKLLSRTMPASIAIKHHLGEGIWPVRADPTQLETSLVNIVTNARDAMPGGGTLTIVTANRRLDADYAGLHAELAPGDYTLIELTDTGTGIPKEALSQIFEPFFTTKSEGRGTGLGLSMVFGFVKQSGGHINVYSEMGVGTTFRLYLPRADPSAITEDVQAAALPFKSGGPETILAVEDNAGLRDVVVRQLTQLGYRCLEADSVLISAEK